MYFLQRYSVVDSFCIFTGSEWLLQLFRKLIKSINIAKKRANEVKYVPINYIKRISIAICKNLFIR